MKIRTQFPFFTNNPDLIYLDTAASAQKPQVVLDTVQQFYEHDYANVHRAIYDLAERATTAFDEARAKIAKFLHAKTNEVVFVRGTTEGINFIATAWALKNLHPGPSIQSPTPARPECFAQQNVSKDAGEDDHERALTTIQGERINQNHENEFARRAIVISALEHHSNLLPWMMVCKQTGAELRVIRLLPDGNLDMGHAQQLIDNNVKLVAIAHTSNVLGTHIDVKKIGAMAHAVGAKILVDAAQSVVHMPIDLKDLDCDFLAFSGHKLYGPSGIGVLFIKEELHDQVEPYQYGGGMVFSATYHDASWQPAPRKFEAGTPAITQAIGLGAAIDFLNGLDRTALAQHESDLCQLLIEGLQKIPKIKIIGPAEDLKRNGSLVSFIVDGMHAHDVAAYLNQFNICVRAGHNCAQPLAQQLGLDAAVRISFGMYNSAAEVDFVLEKLRLL